MSYPRSADWEIGDTAGLETGATGASVKMRRAEREKRDFCREGIHLTWGAAGSFNGTKHLKRVSPGPENRKEKLADVGVSTN